MPVCSSCPPLIAKNAAKIVTNITTSSSVLRGRSDSTCPHEAERHPDEAASIEVTFRQESRLLSRAWLHLPRLHLPRSLSRHHRHHRHHSHPHLGGEQFVSGLLLIL